MIGKRTEELITIGKVGRPRGVDGAFYVIPFTDSHDRFASMKQLMIATRTQIEEKVVISYEEIGGKPVFRIAGIRSREDIARYTNCDLVVPRSQAAPLPADHYYHFDLVGCKVYDSATHIGELIDIASYPANDVYVVRMLDGTIKSVAAVAQFVRMVDPDGKRIDLDSSGLVEWS